MVKKVVRDPMYFLQFYEGNGYAGRNGFEGRNRWNLPENRALTAF